MISRLVATVAVAALIAASIVSGIGRQAIFDPSGVVSGYDAKAKDALARGHYGDAVVDSREAILQRPMDQSSISTFGAAHFARRDAEQAYRAFSVSALLGWRDPVTQRYWIDQSLGQSAYMPAAQWLDAMMRVNELPGYGQDALAALEMTAQGRDAILKRLSLRPSWLDDWGRYIVQLDDSAVMNRIASIDRARRTGITLSRDTAALAATDLFVQQRFQAALRFWSAAETLGDLPRRGLWDGDFSRLNLQGTPGPFDWRLSQGGSMELDVDNSNGETWLTASSDSTVAQGIATTATILPPGPIRLSWKTKGSETSSSALFIRMRCAIGGRIPATGDGSDSSTRWTDLDIPDNCPAETVTIWFDPGLSRMQNASIGSLQFSRLRLIQ